MAWPLHIRLQLALNTVGLLLHIRLYKLLLVLSICSQNLLRSRGHHILGFQRWLVLGFAASLLSAISCQCHFVSCYFQDRIEYVEARIPRI